MDENDVAYVCRNCGEGFAPDPRNNDWPELRRIHRDECDGATFRKTTVREAF